MKPIRIGPLDPPTTRDRGDHWTEDAACTTNAGIQAMADAITFEGNKIAIDNARKHCAECPVQTQCLTEYGDLPHGIIAGLTADQRKHLRTRTYYTAARNRGPAT